MEEERRRRGWGSRRRRRDSSSSSYLEKNSTCILSLRLLLNSTLLHSTQYVKFCNDISSREGHFSKCHRVTVGICTFEGISKNILLCHLCWRFMWVCPLDCFNASLLCESFTTIIFCQLDW